MNNGSFKDFHPLGKVALFFGICIFSLILFSGIGIGLLAIMDVGVTSKLGLQIQTFLGQIGGFLLPVVVFYLMFGAASVKGFLLKPPKISHVLATVVLAAVAMAFIGYLGELNVKALENQGGFIDMLKKLEDEAAQVTEIMLEMNSVSALLLNLLLIAVVPAICEELAFRGVLQSQLAQTFQNTHLAIWVSAFIFSAIHFQFFGFLPRLVLGAVFGYVMVYSGSIWPAIVAHFVNNALGVTGYYLAQHTDLISKEALESGEVEWYLAFASAALVFGIILFIKKTSNWPNQEAEYLKIETSN